VAQDYTNNNAANQQDSASPAPSWLAQPAMLSTSAASVPQKKSRRWLIIIGLILVAACGVIGFFLFSSPSNSCFNAKSYQGLIDIITPIDADDTTLADIQAKQLLYTYTVYFSQSTSNFDSERSPSNPADFLKSIGAYYQEHHSTAPFTVQLSTNYTTTDSLNLAVERVNKVKSTLQQAGLDTAVITTNQPTLTLLNDETIEDDDIADGVPILVNITPISKCNGGTNH